MKELFCYLIPHLWAKLDTDGWNLAAMKYLKFEALCVGQTLGSLQKQTEVKTNQQSGVRLTSVITVTLRNNKFT